MSSERINCWSSKVVCLGLIRGEILDPQIVYARTLALRLVNLDFDVN